MLFVMSIPTAPDTLAAILWITATVLINFLCIFAAFLTIRVLIIAVWATVLFIFCYDYDNIIEYIQALYSIRLHLIVLSVYFC